ncbi:MAG: ATP-dependent helicase, partial [Candidatus Pacebacteria bacterium]|nr:ATP-dependent helicase [Candidatus Paceibacterota bacterium]
EQQSAVDTIEGPVLVVAGPGTGKTQVLAMRIANILEKTDSKPSNILALTFTDSAAQNMKERVVELIGHEGYYAHITTFHSFCSAVINANPEYFPIDRDSTALSDLERFDIFQSLILEAKLEALKPLNRPLYYLKDIMRAISDLKREGVEPDEFEKIIEKDFATEPEKATKATLLKFQKDKAKNTELLELYRAYEARLRKSLRFDFDDMISLVIAAFQEHEVLLSQYQEQFLYFLVDEYQDTNAAQNKVLTLLSSFWGEQANVFAVGDPHQAIYRFQGASLENIYGFLDHYREAKVVTLITGYRCPQPIYSAAHALIGNNKLTSLSGHEDLTTALGQELQAVSKIKALPLCIATPSEELQYAALAHDIARKVAEGVALNDISVLYRNNGEATSIAAALQAWQLPFAIERGGNVLDDKILLQFITLLQVISELRSGGEAHELYECLSFEWLKLKPATVWRVGRAAGKTKHTLFEFLEQGKDEVIKADKELTSLELEPIYVFIEKLKLWGVSEKKLPFPEWFTTVLNESDYLPWVLENEARSEMLICVNTLFSEIKANSYSNHKLSLVDVLSNIAVMQEHNLSLSPDEVLVRKDAIHLSTAHKAKGREWDHVYLVNVKDGLWGNKTQRQLITLPESILRYTDVDSKE